MEAYNILLAKWKSAMANASRLLRNDKILLRINELLNLSLNDAHVDKQLALVVTQNADLRAKVAAFKEYNALRSCIKNKLELDVSEDVKAALAKIAQILP